MTEKKPGAPDAATLARWRQDIQFPASVRGQDFRFNTTWGIFSPEALDEGSCLLLDHIDVKNDAHCIDLGCGYGVLGMTLARLAPQGSALLVDKDFVAVDYARKNIAQNHIGNAEVLLSNGFAQVPKERRFDLAVSNLPAKVSKEQHYLWLFDTHARLNEGGAFYVVTINGLREFIARTFKEVFGNFDKVKQGKTYTISLAYKE